MQVTMLFMSIENLKYRGVYLYKKKCKQKLTWIWKHIYCNCILCK